MARWATLLVSMLMLGSTFAHQLHTASTTLLFNDRSGRLEVMHRFFIHDAEHAVQQLFDAKADIHASTTTQQQFVDYVVSQFQLTDATGTPLALQLVGYELVGRDLWVYQDAALPSLQELRVSQPVLQEIWSAQQNLVNIEGRGPLQSLLFTRNERWLSVTLPNTVD